MTQETFSGWHEQVAPDRATRIRSWQDTVNDELRDPNPEASLATLNTYMYGTTPMLEALAEVCELAVDLTNPNDGLYGDNIRRQDAFYKGAVLGAHALHNEIHPDEFRAVMNQDGYWNLLPQQLTGRTIAARIQRRTLTRRLAMAHEQMLVDEALELSESLRLLAHRIKLSDQLPDFLSGFYLVTTAVDPRHGELPTEPRTLYEA